MSGVLSELRFMVLLNRNFLFDLSRVNGGYLVNPPYMDLLFTLAGLGDVVGGLHPHERVHLHSKAFSMRSAIFPERSTLPLSRLDSAGRET